MRKIVLGILLGVLFLGVAIVEAQADDGVAGHVVACQCYCGKSASPCTDDACNKVCSSTGSSSSQQSSDNYDTGKQSQTQEQNKGRLTADDRQFLASCDVASEDIKLIDSVPATLKSLPADFFKWIAAKDCQKLIPFKNSRAYIKRFEPLHAGDRLPTHAPGGWSYMYLTDKEWEKYYEILENAPF